MDRRAETDSTKEDVAKDGRACNRRSFVQLRNWQSNKIVTDTLHSHQAIHQTHCDKFQCQGSIMFPVGFEIKGNVRPKQEVIEQAEAFLDEYFASLTKKHYQGRKETLAEQKARRMKEVVAQVDLTGTYDLDEKELVFGAKLAWRNAPRCVGRIQWNRLQVFDCRHITTGKEMEEAIRHHIKFSTNGGNLRSAITIFPKRTGERDDFRVWSSQFFRYAGYKVDQRIIGDPANVELTERCVELGWTAPECKGHFDLLPVVVHAPNEPPHYFDVSDLVLEVPIKHPKYSWFEELGLKWYALPAVSSLMLDVGGIQFTAAPFNGWYMGPEIAARNFGDVYRYNLLEPVAERLELDRSSNASLWKDCALLELNIAVLYSFKEAQVTITDHHTVTDSFIRHMEKEMSLRGGCPGDWVWIVPPISGSITPVFHQEMLNYKLKPSFEYQEPAWLAKRMSDKKTRKVSRWKLASTVSYIKTALSLFSPCLEKRFKATILYATETGKSERYAKDVAKLFSHSFAVKAICMEEYTLSDIEYEQLLLVVTSTFGNGDPPDNGESFGYQLYEMRHPSDETKKRRKSTRCNILGSHLDDVAKDDSKPLASTRFSVFGLGSSAYPQFCAFGCYIDQLLGELGGERIYEKGLGDELCGQEESFRKWVIECYQAACNTFCVDPNLENFSTALTTSSSQQWQMDRFRLTAQNKQSVAEMDLCKCLSDLHKKSTFPCRVISRTKLQSANSPRSTILIQLDTQGAPELAYEPGDHLAVFPQNDASLVNQLIEKLDGSPPPDQPMMIEYKTAAGDREEWTLFDRLPCCTIRQALSQYLDITTPPTPQFLALVSAQATDQDEKARLLELSKGRIAYEDWKFDKFPTICEVLDEFPSLKIPASLLLSQLPLLQSRYYSISSSQDYVGTEIHCTVAVVSYQTRSGKGAVHHGVCSSWLNSLSMSAVVPCFVRKSPSFYLPDNTVAPVIMVGPGTGIAPFRSFWQKRKFEKQRENDHTWKQSDMALFFGCRHPELDHIYKDEVAELMQDRVLTKSFCAYSRDLNQQKQYVQDELKQEGDYVTEKLLKESGHLYVCGDMSMAAGVTKAIEAIFREHAGMSEDEACLYVKNMQVDGFYHEDIFGVTLRTAEVTHTVRSLAQQNSIIEPDKDDVSPTLPKVDSGEMSISQFCIPNGAPPLARADRDVSTSKSGYFKSSEVFPAD